jgi:hypothetical protein
VYVLTTIFTQFKMSGLTPSDYPAYTAHMGGSKSTKLLGFGKRPGKLLSTAQSPFFSNENPALLINDPSPVYFSPSSPPSSQAIHAATTSAIKELLQASREGKVPIIWSQVQYTHPQMRDPGLSVKKDGRT